MQQEETTVRYAAPIVGGIALVMLFSWLSLAIWPGLGAVAEWLQSPTAANWTQAVVSAVAVIAGAAAIYWQVGAQERQRKAEKFASEIQILQTLFFALFHVRIRLVFLRQVMRAGHAEALERECVRLAFQRIHELNLLNVPSWIAAHAIMETRIVSEQLAAPGIFSERMKALDNAFDAVVSHAHNLRIEIEARGGTVPGIIYAVGDETHYT